MLEKPANEVFAHNQVEERSGYADRAGGVVLRARRRARSLSKIFYVSVIIPTVLSVAYFAVIASDVYISESRFVVRNPGRPSASGLGVLLQTAGFSGAGMEVYVARDYLESRDGLLALNSGDAFQKAYQAPDISILNRFNAFGFDGSFEGLYKYYQNKVSVTYDSSSTISTLEVRAYSAADAHKFNSILLRSSEELVNKLNRRAQADLMDLANREVAGAQLKVKGTALALARFRDQRQIVDPEKQASAQLLMISKMQDELIAGRMRLVQLKALTPDNPQIPVLAASVASLQGEIERETGKVVGGQGSIAGSAAGYQRVLLDNEFAEKQLAFAMTAYEEARNEALRKQAYIERIVEPNLPDSAEEPRRLRGILTTLAMGLVAWGILTMLIAGVREHKD